MADRKPPLPAVCLVVLDGWGLAPPGPGNAVELARTPVFDALWDTFPRTTLTTHGRAVGLPEGQMGNSEVGHLNLGAGSVVRQDLTRIDDEVADGGFATNPALRAACTAGRAAGRLHLLGLVSGGGVHASMDHMAACLELAAAEGVEDVIVHAFTDGRDTAPDSGAGFIAEAQATVDRCGARFGTVGGRYYAMDRDRRWDRSELAFRAIASGDGAAAPAATAAAAVAAAYARGESDEFILPTVVGDYAAIRPGDAAIFFNFRPDRARQLVRAIGEPDFDEFDRPAGFEPLALTTLTEYQEGWPYPVAYPPARPGTTLAATLAERGHTQLHVAETEKYAHVTYFFNGGDEVPNDGEQRRLVDSPRDVPTYDHKPEMSAKAAAAAFIEAWTEGDHRFGVINFANPDMVGHTGVIEAAVAAIETVDSCLGEILDAVHARGGGAVVTADHGNAEQMLEPDGSPNTAHSLNPVPLVITAAVGRLREGGVLCDVAPTVLDLLGELQPEAMSGRSLIQR